MKKCALVLSLLLIVGAGYGQTERVEMKKTAILGFANLGTKSDDSLNIIFTKSLVNFIGRMPRTAIADYDETKVVCDTFNYPSGKQIDIKTASKIGAKLGCEQVVYGDFTVDNKAGKVAVNVVIMNVKTGETVYSQAFNGLSGLDIFDTVDSMIAAVAGKVTGRVIELAKLTVRIDGEGSFRLWLNGVDVQELTKSASFSESFSAGDPVMVAILDSEKKVVTNEMVMLEKGENRQIVYKAPVVELAKVETNVVALATNRVELAATNAVVQAELPMNVISISGAPWVPYYWNYHLQYTRFIDNWFGIGGSLLLTGRPYYTNDITSGPTGSISDQFGFGVNILFRPFDWIINPMVSIEAGGLVASTFTPYIGCSLSLNYDFIGLYIGFAYNFSQPFLSTGLDFLF